MKRRKVLRADELKAAIEAAVPFEAASMACVVQKAPDELDLHGKTVEEAITLLDRFLEDSYNANKGRVWIVHGKGTGALRRAVTQRLSNYHFVKSHTSADSKRGGAGATQVDIGD